jgi:ankyrin repeat protein
VQALLTAGADPNATRLDSGETALMAAARAGHAPLLLALLAHGANVNARATVRNQTALMWAAAERHPDALRVLLDSGADITAVSKTEMTALMFAIRAGDIESTRLLLDAGADAKARAADGTTMLVLAILNARFELAAMLVDRGADVNANDPHGRPLMVLTLLRSANNHGLSLVLPRTPSGSLDSFGLGTALLAHGADINSRDPTGLTLYSRGGYGRGHMATSMPGFSLVGATAFLVAAANCDVPWMKFLAANGADPQLTTWQHITPLIAAAGLGYTSGERPGTEQEAFDAVKLAYDLGNDPKAVVDVTSAPGRRSYTGATLSVPTVEGATALHAAVIRYAPTIVSWLIDRGVPLDHQAGDGNTALDLVAVDKLGVNHDLQRQLTDLLRQKMSERGLPLPPPSRGASRPR